MKVVQPQNVNQEPAPDYGFLTEPQKPPHRPLLPTPNSTAMRAAVVGGGIVVLVILFAVAKSILSGSNKTISAMVSVAQQQQVLVHLATNGAQNAVGDTLKNFSVTTQLSIGSEQQQVITYLQNNGHKTGAKELNLAVSKDTDTQLVSALSASNFDSTYKAVMQSQLDSYERTLQSAFNQVKGPNGRALLQTDFKAAQLLAKQLDS